MEMKSWIIALITAAILAFGTAANAGLFTYSNANIIGGYGCGLSGSVSLGGPSANVVGTAYFDPAGNGTFTASTITLNVGGVGTCNYSLVSGDGTYNIHPNGTGLAVTLYNLQSGSATNCPGQFGGTFSFVCSEGQFPQTCNIATVDATGSSLLSGTCKKQFPLQVTDWGSTSGMRTR
jgi:hypothetical protein